jgi:hypothetical protein
MTLQAKIKEILEKTEVFLKSNWELSREWGLRIQNRREVYRQQRLVFYMIVCDNFPVIPPCDICRFLYPNYEESHTMNSHLKKKVKELKNAVIVFEYERINKLYREEIKSWE